MDTRLSDINHIYRESPWLLFQDLDWSSLTKGLQPETFCKGSFIYHQNQTSRFVYLIKSGRVNLSILNSEGKVRSLFICGEGALFGEISSFLSPENCAQAQVVSDSLIFKVDKTRYNALFMSDRTIARNTAVILAKKIRALTAQMESMMFPDAAKRVANVLLYLAGQYGKPCKDGTLLSIRFSHQEMANLIGTSRVTVTNSLKQLSDKGVIRKQGGHVQILNEDKLQEVLSW
jgi:CRP-like cAMP-binding protein